MRLYDNEGKTYIAHAEKAPKFAIGCFGRTWDTETKMIDGNQIRMWWDTTWGNWYHFEFNGRWYRLRIFVTYQSEELGAYEVKELFTHKDASPGMRHRTGTEVHPLRA